jgi:hypothetical protein
MALTLTEEQKDVVRRVVRGVRSGNDQIQTIGGYAGTGKAQPLHALVMTPDGPRTMGAIEVGDEVCTPDGGKATVTGVFPQGKKEIFRITFSDDTEVEACGEHLWAVNDTTRRYKGKYKTDRRVLTTRFMAEKVMKNTRGMRRYSVPTTKPVNFSKREVAVDPWLLGVMLGDGSFPEHDNLAIHSDDDEIHSRAEGILKKYGCELADKNGVTRRIRSVEYRRLGAASRNLKDRFAALGLLGMKCEEKLIPADYLWNSTDVRMSLLQGLMDTDGTVDSRTGMASYATISPRLAADIKTLVESLGGIATIALVTKSCVYKGEKKSCRAFCVNVRMNNTPSLFSLERKKALAKVRVKYKTIRFIRKIESVGFHEAQCLMIDHPDHLYLTDGFVPTHNTTITTFLHQFFPTFATCAFTGKAASVMRSKGMEGANTIHHTIYFPKKDEESGKTTFILKHQTMLGFDGFLVDEASMVGKDEYDGLLSFGVPIVFIGDHGQLEPVGSDVNVMKNPMYRLETIHRNAGEIAHFAEHIRKGGNPRYFTTDSRVQIADYSDATDDIVSGTDQIICAFNQFRIGVNNNVRRIMGRTKLIEPGERVICLRNNRFDRVFNGMHATVRKVNVEQRRMTVDTDDGERLYDLSFHPEQFGREGTDTDVDYMINLFDYGYCITTHKSQGSEWQNVLVYEQVCTKWDHTRWAYTAASRAKTNLIWLCQPPRRR